MLSVCIGLLIQFNEPSLRPGLMRYYLVMGASLLLIGIWTLLYFLYLLNETGLTKGNLSSHLARLETAGYVKIEKTYRGKIPMTICRLTPAGRSAFKQYRAALKASLS